MNIAALASLLLALTCYSLAIFILKNAKSQLHRLWALFNISVGFWGTGIFLASISNAAEQAFRYWQLAHYGGFFVSVFFFHVVYSYCELRNKKFLFFCYVQAAMFSILNAFGITGYKVAYAFNSLYYIKIETPLYLFITIFWFAPVIYGHLLLYQSYKQSVGLRRNQLKYLFASMIIGFSGGAQHFFPVYGIDIYPYGNFLISIYTLIASYAIFKHHLLDIEFVIRRAAVFAGLFAFLYGIFSIFTIIGQRVFEHAFGWNAWISLIPTILIIIFALRPLEDFLTNATERYLFQKRYDYRDLLKTFTSQVLTVLELQVLLDRTVEGLCRIIKLESCGVLIWNEEQQLYQIKSATGIPNINTRVTKDSLLIYFLNISGGHLYQMSDSKFMNNELLANEFKALNAVLCLPIMLNERLIGIITLGRKKSGEDFSTDDIDVLTSLARTEAIAISNAQLFQELSATQAEAAQKEKMAVVGTLAAGINHEICNPLGIARGQCEMFLLNFRDGIYKDVSEKELVEKCVVIFDKVINEVDRATGITKRLSSFAKPSKKFEIGEVKIAHSINEVLAILGYELRLDNIQVMANIPPDIPSLLCDKKQIEEIIFNIVRNAAQAITGRGSISITAHEQGNRIAVDIEDTGSGIPPDKINQIFNPFYTTKAPGKGTGLGLFIVKQIVERNRGTIAVKSELGKGTKFTLSFETAKQAIPA